MSLLNCVYVQERSPVHTGGILRVGEGRGPGSAHPKAKLPPLGAPGRVWMEACLRPRVSGTTLALCSTLPHPNSPPFWRDNTRQPNRDRKRGPWEQEEAVVNTGELMRVGGDRRPAGVVAVAAQEEEALSTGGR